MSIAPPTAPLEKLATCPICASNRLYYVFSTGTSRVARCNDCGLFAASSADPEATPPHGAATCTAVATNDERTTTLGQPWSVDQVLAWIARYRGTAGGRMLVVGLGQPEFLQSADAAGYEVTAVDASAAARERVRAALAGTAVGIYDTIAEAPPERGAFDVTVLDGALNNTPVPANLLREVHGRLDSHGVVLATAPSISVDSRNSARVQASIPIQPGCFAFESHTLQSILFQNGFRGIVGLPSARGARPPRVTGPCAVIARVAPVRVRPLLSVVFPAFNEAATVATTLDRLLAKRVPGIDIEVVIVESNSTDGTREIVQRYAGRERVHLILEDRPRGKGRAVRTGLAQATGDFILIQDADLEYDLDDYDVLLEPLLAGRESFVLGARHGGQTRKIRQFNDQPLQALVLNLAHGVFTAMINLSLGLSLKDPFTMYKVFRRDNLHGLTFECNRFDFDWELVIKLVRAGHLPLEIPVNYRSRSFKEGKKVSIIRDPLTWIVALFRSLRARIDLLDSPAEAGAGAADGSTPARVR